MFADDFTPSLVVQRNIIFENNCPIESGNCATFMLKSINISALDNIVADQNYSRIFEIAPYRMPAARMAVQRNILWNTTQATPSETCEKNPTTAGCQCAYTSVCGGAAFGGNTTWDNATLADVLGTGDGTNGQRSRLKQYGFNVRTRYSFMFGFIFYSFFSILFFSSFSPFSFPFLLLYTCAS